MSEQINILYCNCKHYDNISGETKTEILNALNERAIAYEFTEDLCQLAARKDPELNRLANTDNLHVIACFPRTVKWLFHAAGSPVKDENISAHNMLNQTPLDILDSLTIDTLPIGGQNKLLPQTDENWTPWFPVIDYDRCINCKQCLNFCLFSTYTLSDDDIVTVTNPANCKTNCPACAKICPESAIIFPKYTDEPINGAVVPENYKNKDIDKLFGGDIHEIIRQRVAKKKRFAKDAKRNRQILNLQKLQKQLDIPQEVIVGLSGDPAVKDKMTAICPNSDLCDKQCEKKHGDDANE